MGLRHLIPILVLLIQLQGLIEATSPLPQLPGNRLAEGADRELRPSQVIECGRSEINAGNVKKTRAVSQALSYFNHYAFTAGPVGSQNRGSILDNIGQFTVAELKGKKYVYALQVDPTGEKAYWLPQGGYIDIPRHPTGNQPKYVFTPDFSGCSWTVTPLSNGNLRVRHVEGGYEAAQFNNLSEAQKGGPTTYAMQYKDYGYVVELQHLVGNIPAFAYMRYSGRSWSLTFQRKTCASTTGGYRLQNNLLKSASMVDFVQSPYQPVTPKNVKTYHIP